MFSKRLREPIINGEITCSVRVWRSPRVKVGGAYRLGPGAVRVASVREIGFRGVTPELARQSGFDGVVELLRVAKHGSGESVYLVEFAYEPPGRTDADCNQAL